MFNHYINVLKRFKDFEGRSSRAEYWYFVLANIIIGFVLGIIEGIARPIKTGGDSYLGTAYQIIILVPYLAVTIRRMHDVNKSGWFFLVPIYNLILSLRKGTAGPNKYGPSPEGEKVGEQNQEQPQQPAQSEQAEKFCDKCGESVGTSTTCPKCGNPIS